MIPARFKKTSEDEQAADGSTTVTLTIKQPKAIEDSELPNGIQFPDAPKSLGTITETITKSLLTETTVTRVTENQLAEPLIIEVKMNTLSWNILFIFFYSRYTFQFDQIHILHYAGINLFLLRKKSFLTFIILLSSNLTNWFKIVKESCCKLLVEICS